MSALRKSLNAALRLLAQFQSIQNKRADAFPRIALIPTIEVGEIGLTVCADY
jgi:hypothetical protein